ncbi:MAG: class I SAM-dependent methyltransferase [bacterium]|nr:class I SAM-dependent methyltransferase [bacterium]
MEKNQGSKTADGAAACRAWHLRYGNPVIFEDPFAFQLTSPVWRFLAGNRFLSWLITNKLLRSIRPAFANILSRACFTEALLEKAVRKGVSQYILLSSGLDSFALRRKDLASSLKIFEVDHPATQNLKRGRLEKLNIGLPPNLEFVPVDFESESISHGLTRSSFSKKLPSFFSWLGASYYVSSDAVFETLNTVISIAAPGSEFVFDYMISREYFENAHREAIEIIDRYTTRRGEPLKAAFTPRTFMEDIRKSGFEIVEHISGNEITERYFSDSKDSLWVYPSLAFIHLRVCG